MKNQQPVVFIYKRTPRGDPDYRGVFGINDCMGSMRNREFDAVIGIGGKQPCLGDEEIALKINWIGITPVKHGSENRGSLVTFSKYLLYDEKGPFINDIAPKLYKYMYIGTHRRSLMSTSLPSNIYDEVKKILKLANKCSPSKGIPKKTKAARKCR